MLLVFSVRSGRTRKVILTLEVVGSDDSMVLLLLVLIVGELMLVSELESLPVDVRLADEWMSVDEDIKLALESDIIDWVDIDVIEGWEASELDVDAVTEELVDNVLVSILVEL